MNARGSFKGTPAPGPFHCLGCKGYVTGTPSGHCPRCGFVPPVALDVAALVPAVAVRSWLIPAGLAVLAILLVALVRLV